MIILTLIISHCNYSLELGSIMQTAGGHAYEVALFVLR